MMDIFIIGKKNWMEMSQATLILNIFDLTLGVGID